MVSDDSGNPVFTYRARFRRISTSAQRVLFCSGLLLLAVGIVARALPVAHPTLNATLRAALWLGLGLAVLSALWAYAWRSLLRRDFRRSFRL
jgi:hypothetical protein